MSPRTRYWIMVTMATACTTGGYVWLGMVHDVGTPQIAAVSAIMAVIWLFVVRLAERVIEP